MMQNEENIDNKKVNKNENSTGWGYNWQHLNFIRPIGLYRDREYDHFIETSKFVRVI
jgi:hypothetical protein